MLRRDFLAGSSLLAALPLRAVAQTSSPASVAPSSPGPAAPPSAASPTSGRLIFVPADKAPKLSELGKRLETKVHAAWDAFMRRDKAAYGQLLWDDCQSVENDGQGERAKFQVLNEVEHGNLNNFMIQFFYVQELGPDYAYVTYENTMRFPKTAIVKYRRVFIGELWARRIGEWRMLRYQETGVR